VPAAFCAGVAEGYLRPSSDRILVTLRASPGAETTAIDGPCGASALKAGRAFPPAAGRANDELTRFLSRLCCVPRSQGELVRGVSTRATTVLLRGVDLATARSALAPVLA
jgi:uncharacterized protein YggU (UPF0235/DUF167 family)